MKKLLKSKRKEFREKQKEKNYKWNKSWNKIWNLSYSRSSYVISINWLLGASFKTNADIFTSIGFIPKGFKFDFTGYVNGWKTSTEYTFATYFMNTLKQLVPKVNFNINLCCINSIWIFKI